MHGAVRWAFCVTGRWVKRSGLVTATDGRASPCSRSMTPFQLLHRDMVPSR
jgi:hypothetical protein